MIDLGSRDGIGLKSNIQAAPGCESVREFPTTMPYQSSECVVVDRLRTNSRIFAHTRWDAIPVAAALIHCAYFFAMFYLFPRVPLWVMIILGFIYSVSISWNINGVSHNLIHNPYFRSLLLNRLFSILESITVGFSQIFYECIHMQHHKGNADRPDQAGETVDWISIYKHGTTVKPNIRLSTLS